MNLNKLEFLLPLLACLGWAAWHPTPTGGLTGLVLGALLLFTLTCVRLTLRLPVFARAGSIIPLLLAPILATGIVIALFLGAAALITPASAAFANSNPQLNEQTSSTPAQQPPTEEQIKEIWGMLNAELDKRDLSNPHDRVGFMGALAECLQVHNQKSGDLTPEILEELGKCADKKIATKAANPDSLKK